VVSLQRIIDCALDGCSDEDDSDGSSKHSTGAGANEGRIGERAERFIDLLKIDCEGDELDVLLGVDEACVLSGCHRGGSGQGAEGAGPGEHCSWCLWGRLRQIVIGELLLLVDCVMSASAA
jgi:hypothetical protein